MNKDKLDIFEINTRIAIALGLALVSLLLTYIAFFK